MNKQILTALTLGLSITPALAATVEYWDFEDGSAGTPFTASGAENGSGGSTGINDTLLRGYDPSAGPSWTDETNPNGGKLAMSCDGGTQDGYLTDGALHGWTAPNWTLELHVKFESWDANETIVGRDGSSVDAARSDLYLQRIGDGQLRLIYLNADSAEIELIGTTTLQLDQWYGFAIVGNTSEGTVTMYIDSGDGYEQDAQLSASGDLGLYPSTINWTFGRGWYDGGQADKTDLIMDNIRIHDEALAANLLLPLEGPITGLVPRAPALYIIK